MCNRLELHVVYSVYTFVTTWHKDAGDDDEEGKAEEEGSEGSSKKKKPWGDSSFYCPVSLKEQGVLWPGSEQYALR